MKRGNVKTSYDQDADVLSWELSPKGKIDYASEMGDVVVHFTKENKPVYLEVLNASAFLRRSMKLAGSPESLVLRDKGR